MVTVLDECNFHCFYFLVIKWEGDTHCASNVCLLLSCLVLIKEKMRRDGRHKGCVGCPPLRNKLLDTPALVITLILESHNILRAETYRFFLVVNPLLGGAWAHLCMAPVSWAWLDPWSVWLWPKDCRYAGSSQECRFFTSTLNFNPREPRISDLRGFGQEC